MFGVMIQYTTRYCGHIVSESGVRCNVLAVFLVAIAMLAAAPAAAQPPELAFAAGRVSITARDTPLAAILEAWQRRGGTEFVQVGRLPATPVSIRLIDVPERDALRVLLRTAGGYVAIPRPAAQTGGSAFGRIFVMAAGSRPAPRTQAAVDDIAPALADADGRFALQPAPDDAVDIEEVDELDLVETLRRRYQDATASGGVDAPRRFGPEPADDRAGTASRPGVIIAPEPEPSANAPRPARRRPR